MLGHATGSSVKSSSESLAMLKETYVFVVRVFGRLGGGFTTTLTTESAAEALAQAKKLWPDAKTIEVSPPPHYRS